MFKRTRSGRGIRVRSKRAATVVLIILLCITFTNAVNDVIDQTNTDPTALSSSDASVFAIEEITDVVDENNTSNLHDSVVNDFTDNQPIPTLQKETVATDEMLRVGGGERLPDTAQSDELNEEVSSLVVPRSEPIVVDDVTARERGEFRYQSPPVERYADPRILEALDSYETVGVIAELFDDTNIRIDLYQSPQLRYDRFLERKEKLRQSTERVLSRLPSSNFKSIRISKNGRSFYTNVTRQGYEQLVHDPNVRAIYLNGVGTAHLAQSRTLIGANTVQTNLGINGSGQAVCVIDTGIDYNHPDLGGGCFGVAGCKVRHGFNYVYENVDPNDDNGHGTHVAGIIAGTGSTNRGIAPGAELWAMKAVGWTQHYLDSDVLDALSDCYELGIFPNSNWGNLSVVSMSLGTDAVYGDTCTGSFDSAILDLYNAGISVVASSGNDGYSNGLSYPACAQHVISVGATYDASGITTSQLQNEYIYCETGPTTVDNVACFSNRHVSLDLVAPGCLTTSTKAAGGYVAECGTSMAAPHVSGTIALMRQINGTLTPDKIRLILRNTSLTVGPYKRVDTLAAIQRVRDSDVDGYNSTAFGGSDCNDANPAIHPGAIEACDGLDNDCDSTVDEGCSAGGGGSECTEPGFETCYSYTYGNCDVAIAINDYTPNNIQWGTVNTSHDPYVVGNWSTQWKDVDAEKMYYNVNDPNADCGSTGCSTGTFYSGAATIVTKNPPARASRDLVLGYANTASYGCWVWFDDFTPKWDNKPIYLLNCYSDSDCGSGNRCAKVGTWNNWSCVSGKSDGQSCTTNSECQSSYCDIDGVGPADDGWCFTPYNVTFDGQEPAYCEYSVINGSATTNLTQDCDERQVGYDLAKCSGGFYQLECSSTCGYQNITGAFDCTDTGCSCTQPLCHGLTTGDNITTCSAGQTYFADSCTSSAGGQDRGDNICRSGVFATGCSADSQCNGVVAGTGSCSASCTYQNASSSLTVTLLQPTSNTQVTKDAFFEMKTQTCCLGANCGTVQVSLDPEPEPTSTYNYYAQKDCIGLHCTTTHYSSPHFGFEDKQWKPLNKLRSFKGTAPIDCVVQNDDTHIVECLDYNATHRKLRISIDESAYGFLQRSKEVPIRILNPTLSSTGIEFIENTDERQTVTIKKNSVPVEAWFEARSTDEIHVGETSSIVSYVPTNATSFSGWWEATGGSLAMYNWSNCDANTYSGSDKTAISDGNSSTSTYGQGGGSASDYTYCHRMKWQIDVAPTEITSISTWAYWTGDLNAGSNNITKAFYLGNATDQSWVLLSSQATGGSVNHSGNVTTAISNYVENSGGNYYIYALLHYNASKPGSSYAYSNFYDTQLRIITGPETTALQNVTYLPSTAPAFNGSWRVVGGTQSMMYNWTNCSTNSYSGSDITAISDNSSATKIYGSGGGNSTDFSYCHLMKWRINQSSADASQIWTNVRWFGDLHDSADSIVKSVFIGNVNTKSWELLTQSAVGAIYQTGGVTNNLSNYIENASDQYYVYILLHFNATQDTYSNGAYSEFYDTDLQVTLNVSSSGSQTKGLISVTEGTTPFYTNGSNPTNVTLDVDQCQNTTWWVNATGGLNTTYTAFAYANKTSIQNVSNTTAAITLTITQTTTPSNLLYNYTFTSGAEGWSGWTWSSSNGGVMYYNGSDYGTPLVSPNLSLSQHPNGYNITVRHIFQQTANTKFWINTPSDSDQGARFNTEDPGTDHIHKFDGGTYSATGQFNRGVEQTMNIFVNLSANLTKLCVMGVSQCTSSESLADSQWDDYIRVDPGAISNRYLNITGVEIWVS